MVRANQGIRGRATPRSKTRSTSLTAPTAVSPSSPSAPSQQISKAAKRALKRTELVSQAKSHSSNTEAAGSSSTGPDGRTLSKSSLKRLKKKQRNNLAGNKEGWKDLEAVMNHLQREIAPVVQESEGTPEHVPERGNKLERGEDEDDEMSYAPHQQAANHGGLGTTRSKDGVVTEKARKRALAHERLRQTHILSDPAYAKNPFAALRLHAQNTLAFDQSASYRTK